MIGKSPKKLNEFFENAVLFRYYEIRVLNTKKTTAIIILLQKYSNHVLRLTVNVSHRLFNEAIKVYSRKT